MKTNKVLVLSDLHCPYHDARAYNLFLKAGKEFSPDTIVIIGDLIDSYAVSKFSKDPSRDKRLQFEIDQTNIELDKIDTFFPASKKIYMMGNHEDRLEKFISDKAPELFGLVTIEGLLKLKQRKYVWYPYGKHHRIGKLYFTHGDIIREGVTQAMLEKYEKSIIFGHTHKMEQTIKVNVLGESHLGITCGWLGNMDDADYIKTFTNWQLGFVTAIILPTGNFFAELHPIINYKCRLNGKILEG